MRGRDNRTAVFALSARGLSLARKIGAAIEGVEVFGPEALADGGLRKEAARAFRRRRRVVFISAAGIAVRCVSHLLKGKHVDPAVVVVDERGRFSISLLSGHMGGANRLAAEVAKAVGAAPVITTATDVWGLPSAEDLAEALGAVIEDPKKIKAVNSAMLGEGRVFVVDANRRRRAEAEKRFAQAFIYGSSLPKRLGAKDACVIVSSRVESIPAQLAGRTLLLRPREIVAGVGCGRGVAKSFIKKALLDAFERACLSPLSIRNLATIDLKKNERGLVSLARELDAPLESFPAERLNRVKCPSGSSAVVLKATGAFAVAEPAALISSGAEKLCMTKKKTGHVTIAAAIVPSR